ncbi:hypothetical protein HT031_000115 [Scenedesmus sp. PABB004]|nr:hypothetical protein HT031_000115 [Scenedesmus sp. PABB004]
MVTSRLCLAAWIAVLAVAAPASAGRRRPAAASDRATGPLIVRGTPGSPGAALDPRAPPAPGCAASAAADFAERAALPEWPSSTSVSKTSRTGPHPRVYPAVSPSQVPPQCSPTAWAWERVVSAMLQTNALGLNYCHHHAPAWVTPLEQRARCDAEADVGGTCNCNLVGLETRPRPWQGLDCSNYAAWVYNFAFGYYPTSAIGAQACSPRSAPGRLLANVTRRDQARLAPGDLLFITGSTAGRTPPLRVSHVIMWTGLAVDFTPGAGGPLANATLVAALPAKQRPGAVKCIADARAAGRPVWVISDSTHDGPALRPFCGWYYSSFAFARRIINPPADAPVNDEAVALYDAERDDCMATLSLQ